MKERGNLVNVGFDELTYRLVVQTHLQKARLEGVHQLMDAMDRVMAAGPFRYHQLPFVKSLCEIDTKKSGKLAFAAVVGRELIGIVGVARPKRELCILAALDIRRLENRVTRGKICYILDCDMDVQGDTQPLIIALDPDSRIVCSRIADWATGKVNRTVLDPIKRFGPFVPSAATGT